MVSINDPKEIAQAIQAVNKLTRALRTAVDKERIINDLKVAADNLERLTAQYAKSNKQELKTLFAKLDDTIDFYNNTTSVVSSSVSDSEIDKLIAEVTMDQPNKRDAKPKPTVATTHYNSTPSNVSNNLKTVEELAMELYNLGELINSLPDDITPVTSINADRSIDPYENLFEELQALPDENSAPRTKDKKPAPISPNNVASPLTPMTPSTTSSIKNAVSKVYKSAKSVTDNIIIPVLQETVGLIKKAMSSLWESLIIKKLIPLVKDQVNSTKKNFVQLRTAINELDASVKHAKDLMKTAGARSLHSISNNGYKNKYQAIQEAVKSTVDKGINGFDNYLKPKGP